MVNHQATGEEKDEEAEEAQRRETGRDAAVVARVGAGGAKRVATVAAEPRVVPGS